MTIRVDPEKNEIGVLFDFVDLDGRRVLEIGSGEGRLTSRYADRAATVTAVERRKTSRCDARTADVSGMCPRVQRTDNNKVPICRHFIEAL
jgi:cyclopropane fatty-acyl-phospholipid synthase-like methyltransferase